MADFTDVVTCPDCGVETPVAPAAGPQQCAHCKSQFFVPDDDSTIDDETALFEAVNRQTQTEPLLSGRHIRAVSLEQYAVYRNRTWVIVASLVCLGSAGQSLWLASAASRLGDWPRAAAYVVLAIGLVVGAVWFGRKIKALTAAAAAMKMPDPATPPDFSTLSSGGQFVEALEEMTAEERLSRTGDSSGPSPSGEG
jgi:hypothetical protein